MRRSLENEAALPFELANRLWDCDPEEEGILVWMPRPLSDFKNAHGCKIWHTKQCGKEAGHVDALGYRMLGVWGRFYMSHRIVFLLAHKRWPEHSLDHRNGNTLDNRIGNLVEATVSQNGQNQARSTRNKSGVTGVHWDWINGKWRVQIQVGRKNLHLGRYANFDEAVMVRKAAEFWFGFSEGHGRDPVIAHVPTEVLA